MNIATIENNGQPVSYTFTPNSGTPGNAFYFTQGLGCSATSNGPGVTATPIYSEDGGPDPEVPDFTVIFKANQTAASGKWTVTCNWVSDGYDEWPPLETSNNSSPPFSTMVLQVYDATPVISHAGTSAEDGGWVTPYNGDQEGVLLTITGSNFGSSGQLAFCPTGGTPCSASNPAGDGQISIVPNSIQWSPNSITATITSKLGAATSYDVMVYSNGVNGQGTGYLAQASRVSLQVAAANPVPPLMTLELVNNSGYEAASPTVINSANNYSEDTTIRVTAVQADGTPLTKWSGSVSIGESSAAGYVCVYCQNPPGATYRTRYKSQLGPPSSSRSRWRFHRIM